MGHKQTYLQNRNRLSVIENRHMLAKVLYVYTHTHTHTHCISVIDMYISVIYNWIPLIYSRN